MCFWFIPFSIYFILGILIGLNYEQFKEKLLKYKYAIGAIWISLLVMIPIIIQHFDLIYTGYFNIEGIFFSIASIFFFFLIFSQGGSKFFAINGRIAVAIFLISPLILTLLLRFYFPAGWWLSSIAFYLGALFYGLTTIFFFVLAYKLWGAKFFYFNKKVAVAVFLVPLVVFTIVLSFLSHDFFAFSTFDFFVFLICNFYIAYLICLNLIALIKKIPHYEYVLTEIKD